MCYDGPMIVRGVTAAGMPNRAVSAAISLPNGARLYCERCGNTLGEWQDGHVVVRIRSRSRDEARIIVGPQRIVCERCGTAWTAPSRDDDAA